MQLNPTHWPDPQSPPVGAHSPLLDEPMRSLLQHRLDDLERRLADMSVTMDELRPRETASDGCGAGASNTPTRSRPEQAALAQVRAARARIEAGSYGLCTTCQAPIERHRLAGRPHVQHCGVCEQEQQQVMR